MELQNRVKKYHNRFRVLVITTPDHKNKKYSEWKKIYTDNQKLFHKYYIKLLINKSTEHHTSFVPFIELYGFDSTIKKKYSTMNMSKIIKDVESMPMGPHIKPGNQSLFVDYNPKTTVHGLGYKDAEKAKETIQLIRDKPIMYQKQVINTMIGRAENHPNQTPNMKNAIIIFKEYLNNVLLAKTTTKKTHKKHT
jgi:hypothetical protein